MALTIVDRETAPRGFGPAFRQTRPGPERKLVDAFLDDLPFSTPRGCSATVFCEPRIESGFPDLVIVMWSTAVAAKWVPARSKLRREDIQLVHYLHQTGPLTSVDMRERLSRSVLSSLARLEAADLLYCAADLWRPRPLNKIFAARHIIAIEAKVSEWARALRQAFQNTWFASDSYVLLPKEKKMAQIRSAARPFGVRLCAPGRPLAYRQRRISPTLPRSYVSWLFNEWAWRLANL
jgi:hypothetical protein